MVATSAECTIPALRSTFKPKMYHSQAKAVRGRLDSLMEHMIESTKGTGRPTFAAWIGETAAESQAIWVAQTHIAPGTEALDIRRFVVPV